MFLAGGLSSNNVRRAIDEVGAFGLDLCSGVRTDGKLDRGKLEAFFAAAGNLFSETSPHTEKTKPVASSL